jgi:hypothetical protein
VGCVTHCVGVPGVLVGPPQVAGLNGQVVAWTGHCVGTCGKWVGPQSGVTGQMVVSCAGQTVACFGHCVGWMGHTVASAGPLGHWVGLAASGHWVGSALH